MGAFATERLMLKIRLSIGDPALRRATAAGVALLAVCVASALLRRGPAMQADAVSDGLSAWRACAFQFGLFAGLAVLAASTAGKRLRFVALGVLALVAAALQQVFHPGDLGVALVCWTASSAGILAGPALAEGLTLAVRSLGVQWRQGDDARDPDSAAAEWFVRFHRDAPEVFDWTGFDNWIREDRAHRVAYDRVEALWYELDDVKSQLPVVAAPVKPVAVKRSCMVLLSEWALTCIGNVKPVDGGLAFARFSVIAMAWTLAAASC